MVETLRHRRTPIVIASAVVLLILVAAAVFVPNAHQYKLQILMPSAEGTFEDGKVLIAGQIAGRIDDLSVLDNKALVPVSIEKQYAPLHAGTTARVDWKAVVRARVLELLPGPASNPPLPSGSRVVSTIDRVELDNVLAALDAPTRAHVNSLVEQLDRTLS